MTTTDMPIWPMRPLLQDDAGQPITDAAGWARRAQDIRGKFIASLGERPASQRLRGFDLGAPEYDAGVTRTLLRITVDDDDVMEAWLLEPTEVEHNGQVALALHPTAETGKDQTAGVDREKPYRAYGLELAQRGWIVLAPDQLALQNRYARGLKTYDTARFYERFPRWSSVGKIVADGQMALDVLEQLPQTAGKPVSVIGHSLGAQSAVYVSAVDPRPVATVCNCGIYPFADSQARAHWFRDHWYIYFKDPALKKSVLEGPQPVWDFHELASVLAPRRFMLFMAPNDYCAGNLNGPIRMIEGLHQVWALLGAHGNLACVLHNEGHVFEKWQRDMAYGWMENQRSPDALQALGGSTEDHAPKGAAAPDARQSGV